MEEKLSTISVTSKIKNIKLDDFIISDEIQALTNPISIDSLIFDFSINVKIEPSLKLISVTGRANIYSDIEKKEKYCTFSSTGVFELINFDEIAKQFNNAIPNFVLALFAGILISTTRGFAILKSEGTVLEGFILPIIDPTGFFQPQTQTEKKE